MARFNWVRVRLLRLDCLDELERNTKLVRDSLDMEEFHSFDWDNDPKIINPYYVTWMASNLERKWFISSE